MQATTLAYAIPQRRMALRTSSDPKRGILLVCCLLLLAALFVSGCGNSGTNSAAAPVPTGAATPQQHTAASGPAISDKLSFDQLTLESPAKPQSDKNGLVFMHFRYADNDGKVYECVLPKAMSEGQYTLAEWSSTFTAYKLPKVLAVKKRDKQVELGDYPFISPRPQQAPAQQTPESNPGQPLPPAPAPPTKSAPSLNAPGLGPPP